jgi:hypothetical protein
MGMDNIDGVKINYTKDNGKMARWKAVDWSWILDDYLN